MKSINNKLNKLFNESKRVRFDSESKFIIMSDCHRGQGNNGDNFLPNQNLFLAALEYYYDNGYSYIELGDGDELWENRKIKPIIDAHSDTFGLMSKFYKSGRLYMIYGNHDIIKKRKFLTNNCYSYYYCDCGRCTLPLFPEIEMHEGLVLENKDLKKDILLVHGHQCSFVNDNIWPVSRFLVRYLWRPLEMVGFIAPVKGGCFHHAKEKVEKHLSNYAKDNQMIVIAGHTHRPVFQNPDEGLYFNDGSCVHPEYITGIEIENNCIALVKWLLAIGDNRVLYVNRQILEGPMALSDY